MSSSVMCSLYTYTVFRAHAHPIAPTSPSFLCEVHQGTGELLREPDGAQEEEQGLYCVPAGP